MNEDVWAPPVIDATDEHEKDAREFHMHNPHVLALAENLTDQAMNAMPTVGVKMIWERMRWYYAIDAEGEKFCNPDTGDPLKLNNNYHAYYARWMLMRHPAWAGRIRTREGRKAARKVPVPTGENNVLTP